MKPCFGHEIGLIWAKTTILDRDFDHFDSTWFSFQQIILPARISTVLAWYPISAISAIFGRHLCLSLKEALYMPELLVKN